MLAPMEGHRLLLPKWGNWESTSSTFWFQVVWGLQVCGQHTANFFSLMGVSVSAKQLKGHVSEYYLPGRSLWPCLVAEVLFCLPWFSFRYAFLTSLIIFILHVKFFYRQNAGGEQGWGGAGASILGRVHRVLLSYTMRTASKDNEMGR